MMRIFATVFIFVACLVVGGCDRGDDSPHRERSDADGDIRLHPLEVRGGGFIEGFVAYEQHAKEDGWADPRRLGQGDVTTLDQTTAVRLWILPCNGACGGEDAMLEQVRRGRATGPRAWDRIDMQLIRCQVTAVARKGRSSDLRPIIDERRGRGCEWTGSAIDPEWCEPVSMLAGIDAVPRVVTPTTLRAGSFEFVEERGCAGDGKSIRIRGAGWSGRTDGCNSSTGTWKRTGAVTGWYDRTSTLIACGGELGLHRTEHVEEVAGRYLRFRDRDGFAIAVAERR